VKVWALRKDEGGLWRIFEKLIVGNEQDKNKAIGAI
jgi:hypothetical protein